MAPSCLMCVKSTFAASSGSRYEVFVRVKKYELVARARCEHSRSSGVECVSRLFS
jgi:hypothetical protein